jgi:hypothetical protein
MATTRRAPLAALPSSLETIRRRRGFVPGLGVLIAILLFRPVMALVMQFVVVAGALTAGATDPWRSGADWWLASFGIGEVVNLALLAVLLRREGVSHRCDSVAPFPLADPLW